jgi:hypothetical protein
MRDWVIPVGFDAETEPRNCFLVGEDLVLAQARNEYPLIGIRIDRTKAQRFLYMSLGLLAAAEYFAIPICA